MSNEEKAANSLPEQPAAALLFQAPKFQPPKTESPKGPEDAPGREQSNAGVDESNKGQGKKQQKGSKQKQGGGSQEADNKPKQPKKGQSKKGQSKQGQGKKQQADRRRDNQKQDRSRSEKEQTGQAQAEKSGRERAEEQPARGGGKQDSQGQTQRSTRRRRRRTRNDGRSADRASGSSSGSSSSGEVQALKGSTRLEAKRMRRREGRRDNRRRQAVTEAEFLARREEVDRKMVVRHADGADQIAVLEDDILVEHFVARRTTQSIVGNVYLGKVQNVLPSMEAAFIDIGRGRNAVLYAGEVNWVALGMEGKPRRIELAMRPGDNILVQVTKDPIGHKGARLTSQPTLAGRYLVFVPSSNMLGISRKLPEGERKRLKKLLRDIVPSDAGVIVRTAAEGASKEQLADDIERLSKQWASIQEKEKKARKAPVLLRGEPELAVRVVRDQFNEDVRELVVEGKDTWETIHDYVEELSPELLDRMQHWTAKEDVFDAMKIRPQLAKAMDRKVWLPSGGTLVIERTEALTVIDVNTGKFVGSGGTLEETVTKNNLEAAEEIVRQLRLRDIGGIIIIDFVDMVLESNRELVMRRLVESLGRDRTRHQVTEITSLGLVQMTRKRVGEGLVDAFSTTCEVCEGRGFIVHDHPVETHGVGSVRTGKGDRPVQVESAPQRSGQGRGGQGRGGRGQEAKPKGGDSHVGEEKVRTALNQIAAATVQPDQEPDDKAPEPEKQDASAKRKDGDKTEPTRPRTKRRRAERGVSRPEKSAPNQQDADVKKASPQPDEAAPDGVSQATSADPAARSGQRGQAAKPRSVDDIELPQKTIDTKPAKRAGRRRAVSAGRLDTNAPSTGSIVRVNEDGKVKPVAGASSGRRKRPKDEAERAKDQESAAEAVRDLLDS